ncbi:WXG100 family type VII secretion target [Mycobacteroides franklinii]|uniref:WXG100 family type VII secretion target n=1 Tax=Mycobacteroides franklinii TaxID=948102 RepID=UPI0012FFCF00|nr:WXG100 family type VII secretion target [Mycobacteroides franklinii]
MAERQYDLQAMGDFVAFLARQIDELKDHAKGAQRTADGVLEHYKGEGADGFHSAHQDWQRKFSAQLESLTELHDRVKVARDNYREAETANRQMFPGGS